MHRSAFRPLIAALTGSLVLGTMIGVAHAQTAAQAVPAAHKALFKAEVAVDADTARLTAMFKDIHQNPDLGYVPPAATIASVSLLELLAKPR